MAVQPGLEVNSSPNLDPVTLPSVDLTQEGPVDMNGGPRDLPRLKNTGPKWSELDSRCKVLKVLKAITKLSLLMADFYIIVCSLHLLSIAFQLIGGKAAGDIFKDNIVLSNPVAGCVMGMLVTMIFQSSTPSSSMVVSMVSAGLLCVKSAVPIIMGINIGATVTSYIVAGMQAGDQNVLGRVFADAAVNAIFNWLTVAVLLPVEGMTGFLEKLTKLVIDSFNIQGGVNAPELFNVIAKPLIDSIIQLDKSVIRDIATGDPEARNKSLIKVWCKTREEMILMNVTAPGPENCTAGAPCWQEDNLTWTQTNVTETINLEKCVHIFADVDLSDLTVGLILLPLMVFVLYCGFIVVCKILNSMLEGQGAVVIKKVLNTVCLDLPFPFGWVSGYIAIVVGAGMTIIFQSSSVFTSAIMPLVGAGVISLERAYPLTLGSNIGSTATAILTAMACPGETLAPALQIALCHFFFNVVGVLLWYPVPFTRVPIRLASRLGDITAKYRWFSLLHLLLCFLVIPGTAFLLSLAGWKVLVGFTALVIAVVALVIAVNVMQSRCPRFLPSTLRNWDFLPRPPHSTEPWDAVVASALRLRCRKCFKCHTKEYDATSSPHIEMQPVRENN